MKQLIRDAEGYHVTVEGAQGEHSIQLPKHMTKTAIAEAFAPLQSLRVLKLLDIPTSFYRTSAIPCFFLSIVIAVAWMD